MASDLTRESLLRAVLTWYGDPKNWMDVPRQSPYSGADRIGPAVRDGGKIARLAVESGTTGELIRILCDAHEVSVNALGRSAGIPDPRTAEIVRGADPTEQEAAQLCEAMRGMFGYRR